MQRLKLLERYKPVIVRELERLKESERGGLKNLANRIKLDPSRLSELIAGKRNLTTDYVVKMVAGGFITVQQLLGGRSLADIAKDEAALIEYLQVVEDQEWIGLIIELKKKEPDKEKMAKSLIKTLIRD